MALTYQSIISDPGSTDPATIPVPATRNAGDLLIVLIGLKGTVIVSTPAGWTLIGEQSGGAGTVAADTGPMKVVAFSRVLAENGEALGTIDLWGQTVYFVSTIRVTSDDPAAVLDIAGASGVDSTTGPDWSVTTGNLNLAPNDLLFAASYIPTDVSTPNQFSAHAYAANGIAFGTITELAEPDTNTSNDMGGFITQSTVTAGSGTVPVTVTATAGGTTTNVAGPTMMVRVREVPAQEPEPIFPIVGADSTFLSVQETATNWVARMAADIGGVSVTESILFGTVALAKTDVGLFYATESTFIPPQVRSANDAGSVSVVEARSFGTVAFSTTDSGATSVNESRSIFGSSQRGDASSASVVESWTMTVRNNASDFINASVSESATIIVTDDASDSGSVSVAEQVSLIVFRTANDNGSVATSENTGGSRDIPTTDASALEAVESSNVFLDRAGADVGILSVTENSAVQVSGAVDKETLDAGYIYLIEEVGIAASMTRNDQGTIAVSEAFGIEKTGGFNAESNDPVFVGVTETSTLAITRLLSASDSYSISVTESVSIDISGLIAKSAQDTDSVSLAEVASTSVAFQIKSSSDAGSLMVAEQTAIEISGLVTRTAADAGSLLVLEERAQDIELGGTDEGVLSVDESILVIDQVATGIKTKAWVDGEWTLRVIKVWRDGAWVEPPIKVWNGSTWI